MSGSAKRGSVAQVDYIPDERGFKIPVGDDASLKVASEMDHVVGGSSPTNWWRAGLIALFIVAAILLLLNLVNGNRGTDVLPGTPIAAPPAEATAS